MISDYVKVIWQNLIKIPKFDLNGIFLKPSAALKPFFLIAWTRKTQNPDGQSMFTEIQAQISEIVLTGFNEPLIF